MNPDDIAKQASEFIKSHQRFLIIQADNPDADSLGSALAVDELLTTLGKHTYLYCGVMMPEYLHHIAGWDRVLDSLPSEFDASIIVDTSTISLLTRSHDDKNYHQLTSRPCLVLDHHMTSDNDISFATAIINQPELSSTAELVYTIAKGLGWKLSVAAGEYIASGILGDTQGLSNEHASAQTYRVMADLVDAGVSRTKLEEQRKQFSKLDPRVFRYKATLIERTELHDDDRIALVTIPQSEINVYSPLYNPKILMQGEMLQIDKVLVALIIKHYDDGRILCAVRTNYRAGIAGELAEHFGGGGHAHAAGFKLTDGRPLNEVKSECIKKATELLQKISKDLPDETIQYTYTTG